MVDHSRAPLTPGLLTHKKSLPDQLVGRHFFRKTFFRVFFSLFFPFLSFFFFFVVSTTCTTRAAAPLAASSVASQAFFFHRHSRWPFTMYMYIQQQFFVFQQSNTTFRPGNLPEEGPSFRVETSCSIKRLLEDEELCC